MFYFFFAKLFLIRFLFYMVCLSQEVVQLKKDLETAQRLVKQADVSIYLVLFI